MSLPVRNVVLIVDRFSRQTYEFYKWNIRNEIKNIYDGWNKNIYWHFYAENWCTKNITYSIFNYIDFIFGNISQNCYEKDHS